GATRWVLQRAVGGGVGRAFSSVQDPKRLTMSFDRSKTYVIATRGSKLALWQSHHVQELLRAEGVQTKLEIIKTAGDRIQDRFLHEIGGKGLFVKELEEAMLAGRADL